MSVELFKKTETSQKYNATKNIVFEKIFSNYHFALIFERYSNPDKYFASSPSLHPLPHRNLVELICTCRLFLRIDSYFNLSPRNFTVNIQQH